MYAWWSWRFAQHFNYVEQVLLLFNMHSVNYVRQIEIYTGEPRVPDSSISEDWNCYCQIKFRQYWFKQEVKHYGLRSIKSFIIFEIRKNCLISGRSFLLYQFTKRFCSNSSAISLLLTSYKILSNILHSRLSQYVDEIIGHHQCGFQRNRSTTDHIFCIRQILEKNWDYSASIYQLFTDFKEAYDSVRREVLYSTLIRFGVPMKLLKLIKICLNYKYSEVHRRKHLSDNFLIQNGLKQGDALSPLLFNFALLWLRGSRKTRWDWN
jgi:hypothetical protein